MGKKSREEMVASPNNDNFPTIAAIFYRTEMHVFIVIRGTEITIIRGRRIDKDNFAAVARLILSGTRSQSERGINTWYHTEHYFQPLTSCRQKNNDKLMRSSFRFSFLPHSQVELKTIQPTNRSV